MLGYIKYDLVELKIKDYRFYRDIYCSLCNRIGINFGNIYRLGLSYDLVLFMLVFSLYESEPNLDDNEFRCPLNPFFKRKTAPLDSEIFNYSAFINGLLIAIKFKDNAVDKGKASFRHLEKRVSKSIFSHTSNKYQSIGDKIVNSFKVLAEMEKANADADQLLNTMGNIMILIKQEYLNLRHFCPEPNMDSHLENLLALIGQWIYFLDAFDDFFEDQNNSEFNLLSNLLSQSGIETVDGLVTFAQVFEKSILETVNEQIIELRKTIGESQSLDLIENICCLGTRKAFLTVEKKIRTKYPGHTPLVNVTP